MATTKLEEKEQLNLETVTWGGMTWVNIDGPTELETEYLAKHYPFDLLVLDDCLSRIERPKIDEYRDYLFLVFHFPIFRKEVRITSRSQLSVFIGDNYLVTLHKGELKPLVKLFKECQLEEEARQEYLSRGSGQLLYQIIDRLVDYCFPILSRIVANIEDIENSIFDIKGGSIRELSMLRRDVIAFRRIIWPMRAVIASLEPKIRRFTKLDMEVYFGDTVDHVDRIWDALDEYKEVIEGLSDTHDSLASNDTNQAMRTLTVIATVLLPITVVASIYGMNIPLPFQNSGYSFLLVAGIMLVVVGGMLLFFRRKHLI